MTASPCPALFEMRTYTCKPGLRSAQLELYGAYGRDVQVRHLGMPAFFGVCEGGDVNSYTHIWAYQSYDERQNRRAALAVDQLWLDYLERSQRSGYLLSQSASFLVPPPWSTSSPPIAISSQNHTGLPHA